GSPGADPSNFEMGEVVGRALPLPGWEDHVREGAERARALVIGPGLGRDDDRGAAVRLVLAKTPLAAVVAADARFALGSAAAAAGAWVHGAAAHLGWRRGLVAADLLDLVPAVLSEL